MSALNFNLEDYNKNLNGEKPMVIEYWAPWCGYCRRITGAYDIIAKEREDIIVARINIDDEPKLAEGEGIEVVPTIVVYKNGKAIDSVVAPQSKSAIDFFIDSALSK